MKKIKLFKSIVQEEVEQIYSAEKDFEERYVKGDVEAFVEASKQMLSLYKGDIDKVKYDFNMWEVAHDSLDRVIKHFDLKEITTNEKDCYVEFIK